MSTKEQLAQEEETYNKMLDAMALYNQTKDSNDNKNESKSIEEYKTELSNLIDAMYKPEEDFKEEDLSKEEQETYEKMKTYSAAYMRPAAYVVRGAWLHCEHGSHHRKLNLPTCHGVYIGENPVMHSGDCKAGLGDEGVDKHTINIPSFGVCKAPGNGRLKEGNISLFTEVLDKEGLPILGKKNGGDITGKRCKACFEGIPWQNVHKTTRIGEDGHFALTTNSFLACKYGGIISVKSSGQETVIDKEEDVSELSRFVLPSELREEVEAIICSEGDWNDTIDENKNVVYGKVSQVRHIYERYLYNLAPGAFDEYSNEKNQNNLMTELKKIELDIRAVGRALSDDILRVIPQNNNLIKELFTFYNLVNSNQPMDLKNKYLSETKGEGYDFSIWSAPWDEGISPDYMGNYTFGYIGGGHFHGIDFEEQIPLVALAGMTGGGALFTAAGGIISGGVGVLKGTIVGGPIVGAVEGFTGTLSGAAKGATSGVVAGPFLSVGTMYALRVLNPNKTDAEIMCLAAAGVAQLLSNLKDDKNPLQEDIKEYFNNINKGNWGDNEKDSGYISDGFNDFYKAIGLDKEQVIKKERKLW